MKVDVFVVAGVFGRAFVEMWKFRNIEMLYLFLHLSALQSTACNDKYVLDQLWLHNLKQRLQKPGSFCLFVLWRWMSGLQ